MRVLVSYAVLIDPAIARVLRGAGLDAEAVAPRLAVAAIASRPVDAAVLDAADVHVIRDVRRAGGACRILAVADAGEANPSTLIDALRAGADGLALPHCPADIVEPVKLLLAGATVIPRAVEAALVQHVTHHGGLAVSLAQRRLGLTEREGAVCALLERGLPTAEIAATLGVSPTTVRRHLSDAARKAGVHGKAQLRVALTHVPV